LPIVHYVSFYYLVSDHDLGKVRIGQAYGTTPGVDVGIVIRRRGWDGSNWWRWGLLLSTVDRLKGDLSSRSRFHLPLERTHVRHLPVDGLPFRGSPVPHLPVDGLPVDGLPFRGSPVPHLPVDGLPVDGLPVDGLPVDGSPVIRLPFRGLPVRHLRVDGSRRSIHSRVVVVIL